MTANNMLMASSKRSDVSLPLLTNSSCLACFEQFLACINHLGISHPCKAPMLKGDHLNCPRFVVQLMVCTFSAAY